MTLSLIDWTSKGSTMTDHPPHRGAVGEHGYPTPSSVSHPWHCLWRQMSHHSYRTLCHSKLASISQSPPVQYMSHKIGTSNIEPSISLERVFYEFLLDLGKLLPKRWAVRMMSHSAPPEAAVFKHLTTGGAFLLPKPAPTVFRASSRLSAAATAVSSILETTTPSWVPTCTWTHLHQLAPFTPES